MSRLERFAVAVGMSVILAGFPAAGDDTRMGGILMGGGGRACGENIGCTLWADNTNCHPSHAFGHSNMFGHAYNLRDAWEQDKQVRFTLTEAVDAGYGPIQIVFHTRDINCAPIGPDEGTILVEIEKGETTTFRVPGITKWMVVYMTGTGSPQVVFTLSFDHCEEDCEPPE